MKDWRLLEFFFIKDFPSFFLFGYDMSQSGVSLKSKQKNIKKRNLAPHLFSTATPQRWEKNQRFRWRVRRVQEETFLFFSAALHFHFCISDAHLFSLAGSVRSVKQTKTSQNFPLKKIRRRRGHVTYYAKKSIFHLSNKTHVFCFVSFFNFI